MNIDWAVVLQIMAGLAIYDILIKPYTPWGKKKEK